MKVCFILSACFFSLFFLGGCDRVDDDLATDANFEEWYPQYNRYIRNWLNKQVEEIETEIEGLNAELSEVAVDEDDSLRLLGKPDKAKLVKKKIQAVLLEKQKLLYRMQSRQEMGDYFLRARALYH